MSARALALLVAIAAAAAASPARATPFAYTPGSAVIDTATDTAVGSVSPYINGQGGVAMNPAGTRVYIPHYGVGGNGLRVVDTATNTVIANISAASPFSSVAVHPSGTTVYAADGGGSNLLVIDAATNTVVTTVVLNASGSMGGIAVHPDGSRVYVARSGALSVVDTATNTVVATVSPLPDQGSAVAVNPSGTRVYAGYFNNCGCIPGSGPTQIAIIDTATNTRVGSIPAYAVGLAINPGGTRMYASDLGPVRVIDLATETIVTTIPGFNQPGGIAVNPAGTKVYVIQGGTSGVGIIDTATDTWTNTVTGLYNNSGTGAGLFIGPYCPTGGCSDSNPCTDDTCNPLSGACSYTDNTLACASDGNACTTDVCAGGACTHPSTTAGSPCDDDAFCTGTDTCDGAGGCTNHTGDPCASGAVCAQTCNEATDDCFAPPTAGCTNDGNVCTDDHCSGTGVCLHTANTASCDDGLYCNGADTCAGTVCHHSGDPCVGGSECDDLCNETTDDCFDPGGTPCTSDGNPCSVDACDGGGICTHAAGNAGTTCRSATGQCDAVETCTGATTSCPADVNRPDGFPCTDGDSCTNPDVCTGGACTSGAAVVCPLCQTCDTVGGCLVGPRPGCKVPTKPLKASILLQDRTPDDLDQVKWKWSSGQATTFAELGDPLATDDYALCVYDSSSSLILKMTAPAGGMCGTKPCWKQLGPAILPKGYKYKDLDGLPDDLDSMTLKAGLDGKAKVSLKGKGVNVPMPTLGSLSLPLTTQLQSGNGQCYEATTATPSVNTTTLFKAKGN